MTLGNEDLITLPRQSEAGVYLNKILQRNLVSNVPSCATPEWVVEEVAAQLPGGAPKEGSNSPIPFFHILERLKTTPREGWRRFGVKNGESISDHMYRMALMTMFAPQSLASKINVHRCTRMALIHDMAEALVGDITPVEGVSKCEKNRRESTTMDYLTKNILRNVDEGAVAADIRAIWQEYEDNETLESKFVHDIDKIELILQMVEYERTSNCQCDLGEFTWVACKITLPEIKAWAKAILDEREELWSGREHISYTAIEDPAMVMMKMLSRNLQPSKGNNGPSVPINGNTIGNATHYDDTKDV